MNRQTFNQYITDANFKEMFITEMGWNNPRGATTLPTYPIDGTVYQIEEVAERNGFQILVCNVEEVPSSSACKKLDKKLQKNAENYICIFVVPGTVHHLWVAPVRKVDKRDLVLVDYDSTDRASFLYEKMEGLSFSLNEVTTISDVEERIQAAFLINSEKITKDFYKGFKKEHDNFTKFISGIDDHIPDKDNKTKQWYTSVMLNRLMFCYFIQKKGFLDGKEDYLRRKLEWTQQEVGNNQFFHHFYKGFLVHLFHDGLNTPHHDQEFENIYGRIPYLNGGMFDIHQIEHDYVDLDIADEAFESLFDFFDKWRWHLDDRITANGKDINPDVLGYIFEQYINDRAKLGAYYTKEDITEYIGRNTIMPYLLDAVKERDNRMFKPNGNLWKFLRQSGDTYIYPAVKKGHDNPIPEDIAIGLDTTKPNLLERRKHWNERTPKQWALPTEIWRETIERLQRYNIIRRKIEDGEIVDINDFITYNLNIRQFVYDYLKKTDDHLFVEYFYDALQHITILDPTCGSGAFLFAALNILEPLYDICIERMRDWHEKNPHLFNRQLDEIQNKYRSNIQYFIYKSIILRNLYGVDIMVEATEIAKLRLFLKMVAAVEVDKRDPNMGLDPLPDIDFNIRCGNTLVGYATEKELERDLVQGDMFAILEFKDKLHDEMDKVALTYKRFKETQLTQAENMETFKQAKNYLKERLDSLNNALNHHLHSVVARGTDYNDWFNTHQPFHWLAEFYEIIHDRGGFDVIIGNPPYVEYNKRDPKTHLAVSDIYKVLDYKTEPCANLYTFVLEKCLNISKLKGRTGYIVPISSVSNDKFSPLLTILLKNTNSWFSSYSNRPGKLFENVEQRLTIILSKKDENKDDDYFTTDYNHWYVEERSNLFNILAYYKNKRWDESLALYKVGRPLEASIINRLYNKNKELGVFLKGNDKCYYHNAPTYFIRCMPFKPNNGTNMKDSSHYKPIDGTASSIKTIACILNSSTFYWFYKNVSNCRDFSLREISKFPIGNMEDLDLTVLSDRLSESYIQNKCVKSRIYPSGQVFYEEYYPAKSKPIIDEIDKVLARHYGFTDEELDFIINYDIKYRMGGELNEE